MKDNNIWGKLKNLFNKIFGKPNKYDMLKSGEVEIETDNKSTNTFRESLKVQINWVKELQIRFEKGEISESQMTLEQKAALNKLYDTEIAEIKSRTKSKKKKLQELRKKSKNKNPNYSCKIWQIKQAS